jgi:hypothetical protein
VGSAALELYGSAALLRSVSVRRDLRGTGLGRRLTDTIRFSGFTSSLASSYPQAAPNNLAINQMMIDGMIASGTVNPSPSAPKLSKSPKTCIL